MTALRAHGLRVEVPRGWDARIERRAASDAAAPGLGGEPVPMSGFVHPVLHLASFALPARRGDYGQGAVEAMRRNDVFVALVEHDREAAATPLFAGRRRRPLKVADFSPATLPHPVGRLCGAQLFVVESGRPFCLHVVLGSTAGRGPLVRVANRALTGLRVEA